MSKKAAPATSRESRTRPAEIRLVEPKDGKGLPDIEGYAAVFDTLSDDLGGFREKIKRGAFKETLAKDDVRALVNHESGLATLGRTSNGTLTLKEDKHGLRYRVTPPDTQAGRDIVELIRRGDISGSSFGFISITDHWQTVETEEMRTLEKVQLLDVSPVTWPAYPDTTVAVRALEQAKAARAPAAPAAGPPAQDLRRRLDLAPAEQ